MKAIVKDLEIRGFEKKTSGKTGREYLIVRLEDETGKTNELLDWNTEHTYKRGEIADFTLDIQLGKYVNISIDNYTITEK